MFTSAGLFRDIPCPHIVDCTLINCIFNHDSVNDVEPANRTATYDPLTAGERLSPPPQKRRRIESEVRLKTESGPPQIKVKEGEPLFAKKTPPMTKGSIRKDSEQSLNLEQRQSQAKPVSASRVVSPPPLQNAKTVTAASTDKRGLVKRGETQPFSNFAPTTLKESLNPRTLAKAPQSNPKRKLTLSTIHATINKQNDQMNTADKQLVLSDQEMIIMANDEEEQLALQSTDENIYRSLTGQRIMKLRKMSLAEWKILVMDRFRKQYDLPPPSPEKAKKIEKPVLSMGLTPNGEIAILRTMRTLLEGLENYGYVTKPPSEKDIGDARKGLEASAGWEMCDRCKTRFQVFPGRNEEGQLTSRGECHYHYAKLPFRAAADTLYNCCQGRAGSEGCQTGKTHIFKVSDSKRLALILQYVPTPEPKQKLPTKAVAIDCEMGFTTLGMEMIRLTAVSWPQGQQLLDILVRPKGEILDLNTRFSGVSKDQFNKAIPYGTKADESGDSKSEDGELEPEPITKVESPEFARKLLFDIIGPDTPLIGHAIDNDLDVLRIIHPFVVDTVLLYPHPRGLPARYGLRMLTRKYLDRDIQAEGTGHDSGEDARATGELVRLKVAGKWNEMKEDGWTFEKGILTPPEGERMAETPKGLESKML